MHRYMLAVTLLLGFSLLAASAARAEEKTEQGKETKIELADCPKAVQETVAREAPGGQVCDVEKEEKGGKVVYGVTLMAGDEACELKIAADGKLLSRKPEKPQEVKKEEAKEEKNK